MLGAVAKCSASCTMQEEQACPTAERPRTIGCCPAQSAYGATARVLTDPSGGMGSLAKACGRGDCHY
jgi:hypothetical protein